MRPTTVGVPPIFGHRDISVEDDVDGRRGDVKAVQLNSREQSLDVKADYWREKFLSLERRISSEGSSAGHGSVAAITKLENHIDFLQAELDHVRRSSAGAGAQDRVKRLEGEIRVLKMQVENQEQALLREESRRIETEDELRELLKSNKGGDAKMQDRLDKLQTMLDTERKARAADEKRIAHLNARIEDLRNADAEKRQLDATVEDLQDALRTSRAEAAREVRARHMAEEAVEEVQSGHMQVDQLVAKRIKDLQQQLEDSRHEIQSAQKLQVTSKVKISMKRMRKWLLTFTQLHCRQRPRLLRDRQSSRPTRRRCASSCCSMTCR